VLLDVNMPGNGIVAASLIIERLPTTAVVMLTVSERDEDLFNALRAGACGYLLKDTPATRLPTALRGVLEGEAALPRALVTRLITQFRAGGARPGFKAGRDLGVELTPREWQVLELLREELPTAEIASRLGVSPVTVRSHVTAIFKKLHVSSREEVKRLLSR
jgi:DNA-binding NarL/FixJ family response regulator